MSNDKPHGILVDEVLEKLRGQLPADLKDKWTDEELGETAYFLTISGLVPAGTLGIADVNQLTVGVTTNFIAGALLAPYLAYGVIDPVKIHNFMDGLQTGRIKHEEFATLGGVTE